MEKSKAQFWRVEIKESGLIGVWQEQNAERKTITGNELGIHAIKLMKCRQFELKWKP